MFIAESLIFCCSLLHLASRYVCMGWAESDENGEISRQMSCPFGGSSPRTVNHLRWEDARPALGPWGPVQESTDSHTEREQREILSLRI
jgi:hypothetical protein